MQMIREPITARMIKDAKPTRTRYSIGLMNRSSYHDAASREFAEMTS
jgi:hypothetical protein